MEPVDLALCLAIDVSASVDYDEFGLMIGGTAAAFRDPDIAAACTAGPRGAIAVAPAVLVFGRAAARAGRRWRCPGCASAMRRPPRPWPTAIEAAPRLPQPGATALGEGMAAGLALLARCPAPATPAGAGCLGRRPAQPGPPARAGAGHRRRRRHHPQRPGGAERGAGPARPLPGRGDRRPRQLRHGMPGLRRLRRGDPRASCGGRSAAFSWPASDAAKRLPALEGVSACCCSSPARCRPGRKPAPPWRRTSPPGTMTSAPPMPPSASGCGRSPAASRASMRPCRCRAAGIS